MELSNLNLRGYLKILMSLVFDLECYILSLESSFKGFPAL